MIPYDYPACNTWECLCTLPDGPDVSRCDDAQPSVPALDELMLGVHDDEDADEGPEHSVAGLVVLKLYLLFTL